MTQREATGTVKDTVPRPGDYVCALVSTRAWEEEGRRGWEGARIVPGHAGTVIATRLAHGSTSTYRVLILMPELGLITVSIVDRFADINWSILARPTE